MILETLKQYEILVAKLKIMLLMRIWQIMNKTSYSNILKNLLELLLKELKKEVLDSALALLQRRAMVFTAFKIGTFPRSEESQEGEGLKMLYLIKCLKDYQ